MKKFTDMLLSSKYSMRERLFLVGGSVGTAAMFIAFLLSFLYGEDFIAIVAPGIGALIVGTVTYYSLKSGNIDFGAAVITFISTCIILPYGYIKGGGIFSGSPSWFIIGFVVVFLFFDGKKFYLFYILAIIAFGVTTYVGYKHPEYVTSLESEWAIYLDSFMAATLIGTLIGVLQHFQRSILSREIKVTEEQNHKIEQLNEAQNRFFSSMSHEIRTPINTIIGLNEMTLREKNLSEEAVENSLNIQNASRMLLSLINDILDLSKIQSGQMELSESQYETSRLLSEIVNLLWNRAKDKGLQFDVHVGDSIPSMLYGDEIRIKQIIVNLLTNAIKYTDEGGVVLTVDGKKTQTNMFQLQIDVEDTGQGIRKENLPVIFDSFKRVEGSDNKAIEGTGLGLSITKQLVELMNGTISVDSIYTKGSTFRVTIPQKIVSDTPINFKTVKEVNHEMEAYHQSFEAPEAKVLIVDDNDMNRMVCRKLLRDTKVKVDLASSGRECLEKTLQTHYDAIFMDHEMPEIDGLEALQRLRTQPNGLCHDTPVIALTANAGGDRKTFYMEKGFQAYLAKPIHGSLLEATLLQVLPTDLIENAQTYEKEEGVQVIQNKQKRPIMITTDCICDLPTNVLEQYHIKTMPFYIITEEGRFRDTSEVDADNLYQYLLRENKEVRTEASSTSEYEEFFGECLSEADYVIHFSASSKIGNGYTNAIQAARSFGNVQIIDSKNMSSGLGLQVVKAAQLATQTSQVEDIIKGVEEYRENIITNYLLSSIDRINNTKKQSLLTRALVKGLNFEASFTIKDGDIKTKNIYLGYLSDATTEFIRSNFNNKKNIDTKQLIIVYSGYTDEERKYVVQEVEKYIHFDEVVLQKSSATLSANAGIHALGFAYIKKNSA